MKAKFNSIVDDFPPKSTEKVKLHKLKVSYCLNIDMIEPDFIKQMLREGEGGGNG